MEIAESHVKAMRPKELEFTSRKEGYQRFHTATIRNLVAKLETAEEIKTNSITPFICGIFAKFHGLHLVWSQLIRCLSELDCLFSLATVSLGKETMCRPEFISRKENGNKAYLELRDSRNPCISATGIKFVPNDVILGQLGNEENNPYVLLVTGPNMGGKSTILRQTCICVLMAQLGCYVPAAKCILTPVDRIFTRIGASDKLLEGKSTFFVEMEEAKNIVEKATPDSLVIIDELGRGTSTFDGVAIAQAVLENLVGKIACRCLFSTHYHMLLEKVKNKHEVGLFHMQADVNQNTDEISFKYKFSQGVCPESFGIQVAKIAGLPVSLIIEINK